MALAVQMGVSPSAYWSLSPSEFLSLIQARKSEEETLRARHMDMLHMLRVLTTIVYNSHSKVPRSPRELVPFESDVQSPKNVLDPKTFEKEIKEGKWRNVR